MLQAQNVTEHRWREGAGGFIPSSKRNSEKSQYKNSSVMVLRTRCEDNAGSRRSDIWHRGSAEWLQGKVTWKVKHLLANRCHLTDARYDASQSVSTFASKSDNTSFLPNLHHRYCASPVRTSNSKMGPSPPMKRNTGPSGGCQNATFTKNLWEKRERERERTDYAGSPTLAAHS